MFHTNLTNPAQLVTQNDLVGLIVDSITFDANVGVIGPTVFATGGPSNFGYTIEGNTITIDTGAPGQNPFGIDIANNVTSGDGSAQKFNAGFDLLNTNAAFRSQQATARMEFAGDIDLGARVLTIDNLIASSGGVTISGDISNGSLTKNGSGDLVLSGDNSYLNTTVNAGRVFADTNTALGDTAGVITVNDPGQIKLRNGVTVEKTTLNLNSNVSGGGLGVDGNTTNTFRGNVTLLAGNGGVALGAGIGAANDQARLVIDGPISGATSTLFLNGAGTVQFTKNNTFTGNTQINGNQGFTTVQIDSPAGLGAGGAANRLVILNAGNGQPGGTLLLNFNGTLQDGGGIPEEIDFAGSGVKAQGAVRTLGNSNVIIPGNITFIAGAPWVFAVDGAAGSMTLTGVIDSQGANRALTKAGPGSLIVGGTAANVFQGGVIVNEGTLIVQNTSATPLGILAGPSGGLVTVNNNSTLRVDTGAALPNAVQLEPGSTLSGSGTTGNVTSTGGKIAPGSSTGVLNVTGDVTLDNASSFEMEIESNVPGSGFDQLKVSGTVNLNDAVLSVDPSAFIPAINDVLVIIDAASITGTFVGLPEGSIVTFNGTTYTISYLGGDVSLTATSIVGGNVQASVLRGNLMIKGDAAANGISVLPDVTPGSFVISGLGLTTVNSLPSVTLPNVTSITINLGDGADVLLLGGTTPTVIPGTLRVVLGRGDNTLLMENVSVQKSSTINGGIHNDSLKITDSTFGSAFTLVTSNGIDCVDIAHSEFKGNFTVRMAKDNNSVTLQNVSVEGIAKITTGIAANSPTAPLVNDVVRIMNSTFNRNFKLITLGDNDDVSAENCTFGAQSIFNLGNGADRFRLVGSTLSGKFCLLTGQGDDQASVLRENLRGQVS